MRRIRTLIVDDEPLARRGLELRLGAHPDIEIVAQVGDGAGAVRAVARQPVELMLLDVQMPGLDGFATLRAIPPPQLPLTIRNGDGRRREVTGPRVRYCDSLDDTG